MYAMALAFLLLFESVATALKQEKDLHTYLCAQLLQPTLASHAE